MNKKQRNLTIYLLMSLMVVFVLFTLLKVNSLQEELALTKENEQALLVALENQKELVPIDSMLVEGEDYSGALLAYQSKFENEYEENNQLEWRLALTEKLMRLKQLDQSAPTLELEAQATPTAEAAGESLLQKEDSLAFALEKTKIQLARAKKQLQHKSFGQYLTFATKKGNDLHYVGEVKHGKANGFGIALLNSGSRYKGEWKDNQRHGSGTFYWADGQYYEGNYANDQRNGEGTYYWPNGEKYVGHWKNDERCGQGVFFDKDGQPMASGIWKDDKLVTETKKRKREGETDNLVTAL